MRGLDDTDRDILRLLAADARRPYRDIAERVGLSPPAVADRIERLDDLGVIQGFTIDLDRSLLAGGTPVLCDLRVEPGAVASVCEAIADTSEAEHVFATADAHVVVQATLAERGVPELLAATIDTESVAEYDVSLLSSSTWTPRVGDVAFAPECAECGNTVDEEGRTTRLDGEPYHFCCPSCESRFTDRYDSLREAGE